MRRKKITLKITLITVLLFLSLDFLLGKSIYKKFIRKNFQDAALNYHLDDLVYDHKFEAGYDNTVGDIRYRLCTDLNGFRTSCNNKSRNNKKFNLGFIGDSFTEGVALKYEDTYVGIIESKLKNKKIANLAISSYSPSIYFTKINYLLSENYKFDEIIVFMDLSDLKDDTVCYKVQNNKVLRRSKSNKCFQDPMSQIDKIKIYISNKLRLTYELYVLINDYLIKFNIIEYKAPGFKTDIRSSSWTYDYKPENYNNYSYDESVQIMLGQMNKLERLLKKNKIELSVAVYPWPGTLKNDIEENKHLKIWKNFCVNKCKNFYNLNKPFFELLKNNKLSYVLQKYFLKNDPHFNEKGSKLIAENFLKLYKD